MTRVQFDNILSTLATANDKVTFSNEEFGVEFTVKRLLDNTAESSLYCITGDAITILDLERHLWEWNETFYQANDNRLFIVRN